MTDLWSAFVKPLQRRFRRSRGETIIRVAPDIRGANIVDIGGSLPFWSNVGSILQPASVRIFNISEHRATMFEKDHPDWLTLELYDGKRIPLETGEADFAICNSVIEHIPLETRANLASEIQRVAHQYIVQTPSKSFPIELHFGLPFIHWLPRALARHIVFASPFALLSKVDAKAYFDDTQLLSRRELAEFFPGCNIVTETFAGFPKSNIAIGRSKKT